MPETSNILQRIHRRMSPPRALTATRAGKFMVGITLGVGFGAVNTGNNLLFLLLGMMLSLILASGILSEAVLRGLDVSRDPPTRCFAGREAPAHFEITNPKVYPSLSVTVAEQNARATNGPLKGQTIGPERPQWWRFWEAGADYLEFKDPAERDERSPTERPVASAYCVRLDAGESQTFETRYRFPERGRYELPGTAVVTRFPFSLFEKARELDDPTEMIAYPRPKSVGDWRADLAATFGDIPTNERGDGEEFYGLREYRPGDDRRKIHWKRTASRGEPVIREEERERQRTVTLHLETATGRDPDQRHLTTRAFEDGLRRVVGLIDTLTMGEFNVGLVTPEEAIPPDAASTSSGPDGMFKRLALVDQADGPALLEPPSCGSGPEVAETAHVLLGLPAAVSGRDGWDMILPFDSPNGEPT